MKFNLGFSFGVSFLLLSTLSFVAPLKAQVPADKSNCTYWHKNTEGISFYRQLSPPSTCYVDINPQDVTSTAYRAYLLSNDGLLMVFNYYGLLGAREQFGGRNYYFFPRSQMPNGDLQGDQVVLSTATPGTEIQLNSKDGKFKQLSSRLGLAQFTEDPEVKDSNGGGLEIQSYPGLMLDVGFAKNQDPAGIKTNFSKFQDASGATCLVQNSEIFLTTSGGDIRFKFKDQELKIFLAQKCPNLIPGY